MNSKPGAAMEASWEAAIQLREDGDIIAMGGRNLGDVGAAAWAHWALARHRKTSKPITNLRIADFSENCLSDEGARSVIATLLQLHPETRVLKLFRNNISGGDDLASLIRLGRLTELHLSHNKLTAEAISNVALQIQAADYPQKNQAPLWLRVEHNVRDGDQRLAQILRPLRKDICVVDGKTACNPRWCCRARSETPALHLLYVDLNITKRQPTQQSCQKAALTTGKLRKHQLHLTSASTTKQGCKPPEGWSRPAEKRNDKADDYSWTVADFPDLAGTTPQTSSVGSAWATNRAAASPKEAHGVSAPTHPSASAHALAAETREPPAAEQSTQGYEPVHAPALPSGLPKRLVVATGTEFRASGTYVGERGGFLTLLRGGGGIVVYDAIEQGDLHDLWPEYIYAQGADTSYGWFPWMLCETL